jgi:hypothetical protein
LAGNYRVYNDRDRKRRIEHAFVAADGTLKIDADYLHALTM